VDKYSKESISMALNTYDPLKFRSQGIDDLATENTLVITNGKITVDVVSPKKAITFAGSSLNDVNGKGITWTDGGKSKNFALRDSKLWTDTDFNLAEEKTYQINDVALLSFNELGSTVVKSNLRQLGTLRSLKVSGDAEIGQFAIFNSELNRLGINTESPGAAIGINEYGVEMLFGGSPEKKAILGTYSNDSLEIITDNTKRITISNNGDVRVHGKLYAQEVETQRLSPLVFTETENNTIYGKGILWMPNGGHTRQLVYRASPDRIWSTDTIDLEDNKFYSIGGVAVLTKSSLGPSITESNLNKIGTLSELVVEGDAAVTRKISTSRLEIGYFAVAENKLESKGEFEIFKDEVKELHIGSSISLGNSANTDRTISLYGKVTVGVANPDSRISFSVAGPVSFDNKKFLTGASAPNIGQFNVGDIVWNTEPAPSSYIGWVCVVPGNPGTWAPFGLVASS